MAGRLEGKVAVVTGAASGIGRGIALRFAAEGAVVVAGDIDAAGLESLASELGPGSCTPVVGSVTDEEDCEALASAAMHGHGRLDICVANAGAGGFAMIEDHPLEEWRRVVDLCLTGAFLTIKHGARRMGEGSSIVTVSSLNAVQPSAGMAAYCAAKAGVKELSRVAAMELGAKGIRVNCIGPGLVQTNATGPFWLVPGVVEEFTENTTLGRFAQPEDVASLAVFLASEESSFVSGGFYLVDGGASTKRYPDLPGAFARAAALPDE
jgi:NAD(P)-dependent dehydrogenase (short-subunit alcohol dehydrogenase family)